MHISPNKNFYSVMQRNFSQIFWEGCSPTTLTDKLPLLMIITHSNHRDGSTLTQRRYRRFHDLWKTNNSNVHRNSLIYTAQIL